jgi:hypothetical protein
MRAQRSIAETEAMVPGEARGRVAMIDGHRSDRLNVMDGRMAAARCGARLRGGGAALVDRRPRRLRLEPLR